MAVTGCPLCEADGGRLVLRTDRWRLIHASEPGFPAFYRLVWNPHVAEFSVLAPEHRHELTEVLARVEQVVRQHLAPTKVNLASLGNMVAHLHWHLIARFDWDSHYPAPVWANAARVADPARLAAVQERLAALEADLRARLGPQR